MTTKNEMLADLARNLATLAEIDDATTLPDDMAAITRRIVEESENKEVALKTLNTSMRLSSASHGASVRLLVALLTTCMDTELADAIHVVKEHAPGSWDVMGYVMKASTLDYIHADFVQVTADSHRANGYDHDWVEAVGGGCAVCDGGVPTCPAENGTDQVCGNGRWKIDTDITTRTAIMVGSPAFEVVVDRCGGEADYAMFDGKPCVNIECTRCGYEVDPEGDQDRYRLIVAVGKLTLANNADWRVITDYTQF